MPDDDTMTADPEAETPAAVPEVTEAPAVGDAAPLAIEAAPDPRREARLNRLILPILLPVGAAVLMAVFVLNVSRILLASGDTGAIVLAATLIVVILGGAAILSAAPRMRTSSLVMVVSGFLIVVLSAGIVAAPRSAPPASNGGGSGLVNPKGPAVATLEIDALPALKFNAPTYPVKAGIVQIKYVSQGGNHTLAFDDPRYATFLLQAPGGPSTAKVLLKPGSYVVYCTVPGHRQAGMQATIIAQ